MTNPSSVVPRLLSSYQGFNLVSLGDKYCGVPQALGSIDLLGERGSAGEHVIWGDDEAALRQRIDAEILRRRRRGLNPVYSDTPLEVFGPPEVIEIEPIHSCNLRCVMCHVSFEKLTKQQIDIRFLDNLHGFDGKWAKLGSAYEPMAHPQFDEIARGLTERGMYIDLEGGPSIFMSSRRVSWVNSALKR